MKHLGRIFIAAVAVLASLGVARGGVVQADLTALTRTGSVLIGISTAGEVKRSTNGGTSFTTTRAATSTAIRNLESYGNTVVAVGDAGYIVRSTDAGQTWADLSVSAAPAFVGELRDVASKDGSFWVAVGKSNSKLTTLWSSDAGATWTFGSVPTLSGVLLAVTYDAGTTRWTAVGNDNILGARILNSTDGKNWSAVTVPSGAAPLNDVSSNGAGSLLAVGDAGTLLTSVNGGQSFVTDVNSGQLVSDNLTAVVYTASGGWTAGGQDLVQVGYTSGGGATLAQEPVPGGGTINALVVDGSGQVVVTGADFSGYQTITFAALSDRAFSNTPIQLSATATSGLAVSFSVVSGPATISGSQLTLTGFGTVTVRATQAGNATYNPAAPIERSFVVSKLAATVVLGNLNATYDGTAKSVTATTTPSGLAVTITYAGASTAPTNAGTYAIAATIVDSGYAGSASGSLVIAQASQTITFAALTDKTLSASPVTLSASASSTLPITFSVVSGPATVNGNTLTLTGTGAVTVRAAQAGNTNYAAATNVDRSFNVINSAATVTLGSLTAVYNGSAHSATATTSPSGLTVNFTYNGSSTAPTAAGSYTVVGTVSDATYQGTASGTLVISPADQTITFTAPGNQPYSATPITLSATASSGLTVAFSVVSGPATVNGNTLTLTGAGSVSINATQSGNSNYNAAPGVTQSFTVAGNFESWRLSNFTTSELADANISGPNAVYGLDGLTNLVKYALGLPPKTDATVVPEVTTTASDWVYTYTRPASITDVTYAVEVSTNLTSWATSGVTLELVSTSGGVETWHARYPLASAANAYFRLKVTH